MYNPRRVGRFGEPGLAESRTVGRCRVCTHVPRVWAKRGAYARHANRTEPLDAHGDGRAGRDALRHAHAHQSPIGGSRHCNRPTRRHVGGILTRMSVAPGWRGGGRGGGGAGAPPAPRRMRRRVPVRTFVCVIAARSTRQGPPGRCERTTVRSPDALA